jgi:DNA (cytosine-5)-methyltransferase 1
MEEVRAIPWNGYTVASTFAGCGGSSTGYRMAGFRVLYANEHVDEALDSYRANAAPYTSVDGRDVRTVKPEEILEATGLQVGELDLFDGSPPCDSFSTAGVRERGWGKVKTYSGATQRTDDLTWEFVRLLEGLRPRTFVMENVSGLLKGKAKGYFIEMMRSLKAAGYVVACRLLDAQWLGVPQARQRAIFVGVRADLAGITGPAYPKPLPYRYTVREALTHVIEQARCLSGYGPEGGRMLPADAPSPTFGGSVQTGSGWWPPSIVRVEHDTSGLYGAGDITDRPSPTITVGIHSVNSQHFRVIHDTNGHPQYSAGDVTDRPAATITSGVNLYAAGDDQAMTDPETGASLAIKRKDLPPGCRRLTLTELRALCGFPADFILTGTYAARWERVGLAVPPMMMSHVAATVRDEILTKLDAAVR